MTVFVILAGAVGGWAGTTSLSGALIAPGQVVVDSNVKKVQHPTGGVVGDLRVRDGDRVKGGDIVMRLDQTVTRSNLAIITKGLDELSARKARLSSERDAADAMVFPDQLISRRSEPDVSMSVSVSIAAAAGLALHLALRIPLFSTCARPRSRRRCGT